MDEKLLHNRFIRVISLILAVGGLILLLKVLNWVPLALDKEIIRRYNSIEQVREMLEIEDIHIPKYFPQPLRWPPSEILAQGKPFSALMMEFRNVENGQSTLIITQAGGAHFNPDDRIKIDDVKERVGYALKEREALLEVGLCGADETCSKISWDEGAYKITVFLKAPPIELIKIAESMLR